MPPELSCFGNAGYNCLWNSAQPWWNWASAVLPLVHYLFLTSTIFRRLFIVAKVITKAVNSERKVSLVQNGMHANIPVWSVWWHSELHVCSFRNMCMDTQEVSIVLPDIFDQYSLHSLMIAVLQNSSNSCLTITSQKWLMLQRGVESSYFGGRIYWKNDVFCQNF